MFIIHILLPFKIMIWKEYIPSGQAMQVQWHAHRERSQTHHEDVALPAELIGQENNMVSIPASPSCFHASILPSKTCKTLGPGENV